MAGFEDVAQRLVDDQRVGPGREVASDTRLARGGLEHLGARLRGASGVGDEHVGQQRVQPLAHRRSERCAAVSEAEQRRGVVVVVAELVEERAEHCVADQRHEGDPLSLDRPPDVGRLETAGIVGKDDGAATAEVDERGPLGGAVHQGREHQHLEGQTGLGGLGHLLVGVQLDPRAERAAPIAAL